KAALIDEFQDTDPVQWSIFERIFTGIDVPMLLVLKQAHVNRPKVGL
nr:UvrD-helicase domain-containing protein [Deltaproteobacteria bacterium]